MLCYAHSHACTASYSIFLRDFPPLRGGGLETVSMVGLFVHDGLKISCYAVDQG